MSRRTDLKWFLKNRAPLAKKLNGRWLVVVASKLDSDFATEEQAIEHAISAFGLEGASVFHATSTDPFISKG